MAAFELLMWEKTGHSRFTIGTVVAGRRRPEVYQLCGFFAKTLVIPCDLDRSGGFEELVKEVQRTTVGALSHPDLPFEKLAEEIGKGKPPFSVFFAFQQEAAVDFSEAGIKWDAIPTNTGASKFDLAFYINDDGRQFSIMVEFSTELFLATSIEALVERFTRILAGHLQRKGDRFAVGA